MGSCCRKQAQVADVYGDDTGKGDVRRAAAAQVSPFDKRGCTDIIWLVLFIVAWVVYIVVTIAGVSDGDPVKLFKPRDFSGAYCGLETNWNDGPNLVGKEKQSYTMNVSASTDQIAKQLLCSTATANFLLGSTSPLTAAQQDTYACGCCLGPCQRCTGGLNLGKGGSVSTTSSLQSTISGRMSELMGVSGTLSDFFDPAGFNGDFATGMWGHATEYFTPVCLESCGTDFGSLGNWHRTYTYVPSADNPLRAAWDALKTSTDGAVGAITTAINTNFTFKALPESACPYLPVYCVPFPGVTFTDFAADYCAFDMATNVKDVIGTAAADTFTALGGNAFADISTETLGTWMGDFEKSYDTFIIVGLLAFVVALIFLVVLRFFVAPCVWTSVGLVLFCFLVGGGIVFVRSGQCSGAGLFDSGRQMALAVTVAGTNAVSTAVSSGTARSEELTGDGSTYVGSQQRTVSGYQCKDWSQAPARYWPALRVSGNLENNFCRNPYNASTTTNRAVTIWCFTTDETKGWEVCSPIGVIQPECHDGHAVEGQTARDVLKVCAIGLWVLGVLWIILVACFCSRIRLAIKLNQVAAHFLSHAPECVLVPVVQAILGIIWALAWVASACFLLSQVPDGYIPKGAFDTYAEAYGTADEPGRCTDKWPTGFTYRDETCTVADPKCWRCAPPRYIFDVRFFISFFVYLWNNAFLIALGQCSIAGAVGIWFFTPNSEKGKVYVLMRSIYNTFRFHTGSLAFGAFILAVVQFIRYGMLYLERQAEAQKNRCMACVFRVLQYIIWCLEKFIRFLTKNAYIQVALKGTPFCTSAKKAWEIIRENFLRFGVVATLGRVVHLLGMLFIMSATTIIGYFILKEMHPEISPVVPLLSYIVTSYVVGKLYMSVFALAVDTCLQCVIVAEEMEVRDASFVPSQLKSVLGAKGQPAWKKEASDTE